MIYLVAVMFPVLVLVGIECLLLRRRVKALESVLDDFTGRDGNHPERARLFDVYATVRRYMRRHEKVKGRDFV